MSLRLETGTCCFSYCESEWIRPGPITIAVPCWLYGKLTYFCDYQLGRDDSMSVPPCLLVSNYTGKIPAGFAQLLERNFTRHYFVRHMARRLYNHFTCPKSQNGVIEVGSPYQTLERYYSVFHVKLLVTIMNIWKRKSSRSSRGRGWADGKN